MKSTFLTAVALISLSVSHSVFSDEFADTTTLDSHVLERCATASMRKMLFNLGRVALYLENCNEVHAEALTEQPVKLVFNYQRAFDGEDFIKSSTVLIQRNIDTAEFAGIHDELAAFNANYQAIAPGETYAIAYSQATGLILLKNDRLISQSDSTELAAAYFTIWFGEDPFSTRMKNDLLSR